MVGVCLVPSLTFVMLFSGIGFGFEVNQELRKYSFYSNGLLSLGVAIAVVGVLADFGSWQHIWKWLALLAETVATLCFIVGGTLTVDRYPAGNWNHQTRAALCVALTLALCVCVRSSDGRVSPAHASVYHEAGQGHILFPRDPDLLAGDCPADEAGGLQPLRRLDRLGGNRRRLVQGRGQRMVEQPRLRALHRRRHDDLQQRHRRQLHCHQRHDRSFGMPL